MAMPVTLPSMCFMPERRPPLFPIWQKHCHGRSELPPAAKISNFFQDPMLGVAASHFLFRALFIGLPAVCLGMLIAYASVFSPGVQWPGILLFGWQGRAPALYLNMGGTLLTLLQIAALTLLPYLIATLVPVLKVATADTHTCFEGDGP